MFHFQIFQSSNYSIFKIFHFQFSEFFIFKIFNCKTFDFQIFNFRKFSILNYQYSILKIFKFKNLQSSKFFTLNFQNFSSSTFKIFFFQLSGGLQSGSDGDTRLRGRLGFAVRKIGLQTCGQSARCNRDSRDNNARWKVRTNFQKQPKKDQFDDDKNPNKSKINIKNT